MLRVCLLSTVMCAGLMSGVAGAQSEDTTQPAFEAPSLFAPDWSDDGIAQVAKKLTGTWASSGSVGGSQLMMAVAPAPVEGMSDTLYVESVRADTPWAPYRRAMFQLYRYKGEIRLRTYEFAVGSVSAGLFDGMWAATEYFPEISADDLIATLDVELETTQNGFVGSTPYPYPTGVGGAVEMTSSMTLDGDTLSVADRGYGADGSIVWGADADSAVEFKRTNSYASVDRRPDGMIIVDYGPENEVEPQDGYELHVHYDGYLLDGTRFDSSYSRDLPFVFQYPPGTRAITGWGIGMEGFDKDSHRKLIIPGYLGYGDMGNPRANIPGNATLVFNVWMAHIEPLQANPTSGHTHTHDDGTVHEGPDHD
ncbi:MAG: CpcT/CpeT family chromophore lyase [Phycisphaerales bacterium JB052]